MLQNGSVMITFMWWCKCIVALDAGDIALLKTYVSIWLYVDITCRTRTTLTEH